MLVNSNWQTTWIKIKHCMARSYTHSKSTDRCVRHLLGFSSSAHAEQSLSDQTRAMKQVNRREVWSQPRTQCEQSDKPVHIAGGWQSLAHPGDLITWAPKPFEGPRHHKTWNYSQKWHMSQSLARRDHILWVHKWLSCPLLVQSSCCRVAAVHGLRAEPTEATPPSPLAAATGGARAAAVADASARFALTFNAEERKGRRDACIKLC